MDVRRLMEAERIHSDDFPDVADEWLENFFTEPGGTIYTDLRRPDFQAVLASSASLFAYYVYGTPSGRLGEPGEEAWYGQGETAPVKWGKPNKRGLYGITGGVWELVGDGREWRGGSWGYDNRRRLRVALHLQARNPHCRSGLLGSRPSARRPGLKAVKISPAPLFTGTVSCFSPTFE